MMKLFGKNGAAVLITTEVALMMSACNPTTQEEEKTKPLNFVIIYTDELQFSDLGCYGGIIPTPNIDALTAEGTLFTSAYTVASMCTPSRYSLLTGQFPGRCTADSFIEENPINEPYNIAWNSWITEGQMTLPKILGTHGYVTGMAGKWHIGEVPDHWALPLFNSDENLDSPMTNLKLQQQQEIYQQLVEQYGGFDEATSVVWTNYDGHPLKSLHFHNFPWMASGAISFIKKQQNSGHPFFLYFTPTAIHGPNHVEDLNIDITYTPGGRDTSLTKWLIDLPVLKEQLLKVPEKEQHRYVGISQTDHVVGLIRDQLELSGFEKNTVVILMADHNIEPGKATSFEKGIHIPMIVYWPGLSEGRTISSLVQNTDIYPTILDAAGIPLPENYTLDGTSIKPILEGRSSTVRKYIFAENGYTRSVCDGQWKYIALRYPSDILKQMKSGELDYVPSYVKAWPQAHSALAMKSFPYYFDQDQLYDLKTDPYEQNNLYDAMKESEKVKELQMALKDHLASFIHPFNLDPVPFMETSAYSRLTKKNLAYDIYQIPWVRRDHGEITWPPDK